MAINDRRCMGGFMDAGQEMKQFADNLADYIVRKYVQPRLDKCVSYFMAEVTEAPNGGVIKVQRPFDSAEMSLPYTAGAASLQVGDKCTVIVLGSMQNAVVVADGSFNAVS